MLPSAQAEKLLLRAAKLLFDLLTDFQELIAGSVEPVLRGFRDRYPKHLRQCRPVRPIDQRPFTQRLDQPVGHHQLGRGDLFRPHAEFAKNRREPQRLPCLERNQVRSESDHVIGSYPVDHDAIKPCCSGSECKRLGLLRDFHDAHHPLGAVARKSGR
jgi:hypothetical protein